MTRSTRSLALRIAQLIEDHSDKELRDAIDLLRSHGHDSTLLAYLAGDTKPAVRSKQRDSGPSTSKPLSETTSRAVLKLRDENPEKFKLLSEFDLMVRRGQLLPTHEDLRRFGERISKEFEPRKSRKETIGALMAVLAERPIAEVERLIEFAASFGIAGATDEYQRLAQFLIKGKSEV
mgnify:CR=1 FL=1